jgi:hypothetical protein
MNIVKDLGLKAVPGWLAIFFGLIETLHTMNFIGEHLRWLATPLGNLFVIAFGLVWLFVVGRHSTVAAVGKRIQSTGASSRAPLAPLQEDAIALSVELLDFLKRLGPPPAPKYTAEEIAKMTSSQMRELIDADDGDFGEAMEYHQGDGVLFIQTANAYSNKITARWKRLLPWYQKVGASYALDFKDKVDKIRNRFVLEGMTADALLLPVEGKEGEKRIRDIAATLWELAFKISEKGASS